MCECITPWHPEFILAAKRAGSKPHIVYGLYCALRDAGPLPLSVAALAAWCRVKPNAITPILGALQVAHILDDHNRPIGEWAGDAVTASQQRHSVTDASRIERRRELTRLRTEAWRQREAMKALDTRGICGETAARPADHSGAALAAASPSVTASPLLEEEQDQDDLFVLSSDERTRDPVDNRNPQPAGNPWGGSGNQAEAAKQARRERWKANMLAEAQLILPANKYERLVTAVLTEPMPAFAQQELDRIDAVVRRRQGRDPPPSLRQGYLKMPISGGLPKGSRQPALYETAAHRKAG